MVHTHDAQFLVPMYTPTTTGGLTLQYIHRVPTFFFSRISFNDLLRNFKDSMCPFTGLSYLVWHTQIQSKTGSEGPVGTLYTSTDYNHWTG